MNIYTKKETTELESYQKEACMFSLNKYWSIINQDVGTGKSLVAIMTGFALINKNLADRYIICCTKNSLKSLKDDMLKFTNNPVHVISDLKELIYWLTSEDIPTKLALITYELKEHLYIVKHNSKRLNPELIQVMLKLRVGIGYDEVHKFCKPTSTTTKVFKQFNDLTQFSHGYTATIMTSHIEDIYYLISFFDNSIFQNYSKFLFNFTKNIQIPIKKGSFQKRTVITKLINLDKLVTLLSNFTYIYMPESKLKYVEYKYKLTEESTKEYVDIAIDDEFNDEQDQYSVRMLKLQYLVDSDPNKIDLAEKIIKENIHKGVVMYVQYYQTLDHLIEMVNRNNIKYLTYNGKMTIKQREKVLNDFKLNPENTLIIISDAGGQSINLQVTDCILVYNLPYTLGSLKQLLGRISRKGSKYNEFYAHLLLGENTVDAYKYEYVLANKEVYTNLYGFNVKLPEAKNENFDNYALSKMRKEYMWNIDKTLEKTSEKSTKPKKIDNNFQNFIKTFWKPSKGQ